MHGANAPVDKTDWSPLAGKAVLIWPDRDKPGFGYAEAASQAVLMAGATSCAILLPPDAKPEGWDAADALAEGSMLTSAGADDGAAPSPSLDAEQAEGRWGDDALLDLPRLPDGKKEVLASSKSATVEGVVARGRAAEAILEELARTEAAWHACAAQVDLIHRCQQELNR